MSVDSSIKLTLKVSDKDFKIIEQRLKEIITENINNIDFKNEVASSILEHSKEFFPYDTGNLLKSTVVEKGSINHKTIYARRLYYGDSFNFKKEKHPLATAHWLDVGLKAHIGEIANDVNKAFKKYAKK